MLRDESHFIYFCSKFNRIRLIITITSLKKTSLYIDINKLLHRLDEYLTNIQIRFTIIPTKRFDMKKINVRF